MSATHLPRAGLEPSFRLAALHLLLIGNLALAQPLYDLLGRHAAFFVARGSQPLDMWLLVAILSLLVPLAPVVVLAFARLLGRRVFYAALAAFLALGIAAVALPAIGDLELPAAAAAGLALAVGLLFALAYRRFEPLRFVLTLLSPAILIFPAVFLLATPVERVVFPDRLAFPNGTSSNLETNVVFVIFDMLPTSALLDARLEIDAERFPGFARLADDATWYRRAMTVSQATNYAVPALLTGRRPAPQSLPVVEDHPRNLFTLLRGRGETLALESTTRLCPADRCREEIGRPDASARMATLLQDVTIVYQHLLLPEAWSHHLPPIDTQWTGFRLSDGPETETDPAPAPEPPAEETRLELRLRVREHIQRALWDDRLARFETFLEQLGRQERPGLSYLHLNLPHGPYLYLPSSKSYVPGIKKYRKLRLHVSLGKLKPGGGPIWSDDEYLVALAYQRFFHHLELADSLLGDLLDRLQELGLYESSLIVVAADHGQSYRPGALLRTMADADTVHVPLFLKLPHQDTATVDDGKVSTLDVLPTLVDYLDLEPGWDFDGFSLLDPATREERARRAVAPELANRLEDGVELKLARIGVGEGTDIYRSGAHADLLGKRVRELLTTETAAPAAPARLRASLHLERLLRRVDPASDFVPAFLTGEVEAVEGEIGRPLLAVAINGVVRAVSPAFEIEGRGMLFAVMVPESAFRAGRNRWGVYEIVSDASGQARLLPTDRPEPAPPRPKKSRRPTGSARADR